MRDIRQTKEYADYLKSLGWIVEEKEKTFYFIKKIAFLKVLKLQRPDNLKIKDIFEIAQKHGVFHIIVEPKNKIQAEKLKKSGFKLSKSPYLPTKTIYIDLKKPEDKIFASLSKKTRYSIRKGEGLNNIKIISSPKDIKKFQKAWKNSVNLKRYVPSSNQLNALAKMFTNYTPLFLASHNKNAEIIGGSIFTRSDEKISYYWQNFSNKEGRTSLSSYLLLWRGILWAKSKGCKYMDLEGVYDERFPIRSWLGFTRFKKGFNGKVVKYPGAYTKLTFPWVKL